jgi:tyrosinase
MSAPRLRLSLQYVQQLYDSGEDRSMLENLVRAWRGIKALPPYHPNSFFAIAGYHGEPFSGPGVSDPSWWGGYCNHGNVLFPTWHRAYLLRLEDALRSVPGCQNVSIPYWDETADLDNPIPSILTSPTFDLDGDRANPLYSYTLQETLVENVAGAGSRYTKTAGYKTVRYPLSGLVGTSQDSKQTEVHNAAFPDAKKNVGILGANVSAWLKQKVQITPDGDPKTRYPDTFSIAARFRLCLEAPNYTVFSNTTSQNQWISDHGSKDPHYVVALESPHNAMHLAVGGFYQKGVYNADPILGANGDMGDNETASFDPLFWFHHAFIDYAFWTWQKRSGLTRPGSLAVIKGYPGTVVPVSQGQPFLAPGTPLDSSTPLYPFRKADQTYYTSNDVTDIRGQLGYDYGVGSLHALNAVDGGELLSIAGEIEGFKHVGNVNRADYPGSFVIRTYTRHPGTGESIEVGHEPVLSRRNIAGCRNCQDKLDVVSLVPIYHGMLDELHGGGGGARKSAKDLDVWAEIHTHDDLGLRQPKERLGNGVGAPEAGHEGPIVGNL